MDCKDIPDLVDAFLDGELDALTSRGMESHLDGCPDCSALIDEQRALSRLVRRQADYFTAPPALRERLIASVSPSTGGEAAGPPPASRRAPWRRWSVPAASAALLAASLALFLATPSTDDQLADEVVSDHIRSLLMADHLADVPSSDQHTVKPWFDGKVEVAPPVVDHAQAGFPLIGGRLDYLDHRRAAAVVYRHDKHLINVFVLPGAAGIPLPTRTRSIDGYNVIAWTSDGMRFWAVSDLEVSQLDRFVDLIHRDAGTKD